MAAPTETPKPNKRELFVRGMVYDAISRLLPLEGRDFTVELQLDAQLAVKLVGITALGIAFAEHCSENMQEVLSKVADEQGVKMSEPSKNEMMINALKNGRVNAHIGTTKSKRATISTTSRQVGARAGDTASSYPPKCPEQSIL